LKIYKQGVTNFLWDTLELMQNNSLFDDYNLVGDTALSLQIGHRISDDIDLFTEKDMPREKILDFVKRNITENVKILNNEGSIFQILLNNELKVDFVQYPYKLLDPIIKLSNGIRMIGKNDISAMKMSATGTRGNEAKDYVDLYYLLKEIRIDDIVNNFKKKYKTEDILHYQRSMIYFDDVSDNSWKSIRMISDNLIPDDIKRTLSKAVIEYERKTFV